MRLKGDAIPRGPYDVATYAAYGFLPGATVEVDGKAIVEKGVLKVARQAHGAQRA